METTPNKAGKFIYMIEGVGYLSGKFIKSKHCITQEEFRSRVYSNDWPDWRRVSGNAQPPAYRIHGKEYFNSQAVALEYSIGTQTVLKRTLSKTDRFKDWIRLSTPNIMGAAKNLLPEVNIVNGVITDDLPIADPEGVVHKLTLKPRIVPRDLHSSLIQLPIPKQRVLHAKY